MQVEQDNSTIDIDEGAGEISVSIPVKSYSPSEFAAALSNALNSQLTQGYSVSFNRTSRSITISSDGTFSILIASGSHTVSTIYSNMGFTGGVDLTGSVSYVAPSTCGFEYKPQFYLLDYTPLEHNVKSVNASINESGSGAVEVIRFGTKRMCEFSIEMVTNSKFMGDTIWNYDGQGVESTLNFMNFCIQKSQIEFMPDLTDVANYSKLILEATESDSNGTGFKLLEMLDYGAGVFKTGKLMFREVTQ